jgi:hypothetical protein
MAQRAAPPPDPANRWQRRHAPIARHGHPDKPTAPASPWQNGFAERLSDRSGVNVWTTSLSWRDAFASGPEILRLLQLRQNASILERMRRFLARFSEPM